MTSKISQYQKEYYLKNKNKVDKRNKEYYLKNKSRLNKLSLARNRVNPKRRTKEFLENQKRYLVQWRKDNKGYEKGRSPEDKFIASIESLTRKTFKKKDRCKICGLNKDLEFHHWRYRRPIQLRDFSTLCKDCHKVQHHKYITSFGGKTA